MPINPIYISDLLKRLVNGEQPQPDVTPAPVYPDRDLVDRKRMDDMALSAMPKDEPVAPAPIVPQAPPKVMAPASPATPVEAPPVEPQPDAQPDYVKMLEEFHSLKQQPAGEYKDIVRGANENELTQNLLRSGNQIGNAIAGVPLAQSDNLYQANIADAKAIPQQYLDIKKQERDDVESPVSKEYQQMLSKYGVNLKASANDLEKLFPTIYKAKEAAIEKVQDRKLKDDQFKQKWAEIKELQNQRLDAKKGVQDAKLEKADTDRKDKMGKLIASEIASSRSAFGKGANIVRSAEAIEQLAGSVNPNELDSRQIQEIARNLDAMLSSGASTISGTKKLVPSSAAGKLASLEEYISNIPKGQQQGEFVKRMLETVQREKDLAKRQVANTQKKLLAPYADLHKKDPDGFNFILQQNGLPNYEELSSDYNPKQEAGIKAVMDSNGISREDAIAALKKAKKL